MFFIARMVIRSCLLFGLLVSPALAQDTSFVFQLVRSGPGLSLHKEMFMLPVTLSSEYNGSQTEAVFQISAKHRIFETRIYFAYTQISFWQAYDHSNSAPFRETDYNPEIFYRFKPFPFQEGKIGADIGFEHQSNGQRPPISRSWNLIYITPYYYTSRILIHLKLRYRIPENKKQSPEDAVGDDNPDITDYLGYTDLNIFWRLWNQHIIHLILRGNLSFPRGGICLNYSIPVPKSERSYIGLRFSHGYGESLVDYNKSLTRVGLGIMFVR